MEGKAVEEGGAAAVQWARLGAGAALQQPFKLESAYGLHAQPTHVVPGYVNALDWIFFDKEQLEVTAVAPLPKVEELTREVAMPSTEFPSDHVALCCDLAWREKRVHHSSGP